MVRRCPSSKNPPFKFVVGLAFLRGIAFVVPRTKIRLAPKRAFLQRPGRLVKGLLHPLIDGFQRHLLAHHAFRDLLIVQRGDQIVGNA